MNLSLQNIFNEQANLTVNALEVSIKEIKNNWNLT
jgi:hypothetical protein